MQVRGEPSSPAPTSLPYQKKFEKKYQNLVHSQLVLPLFFLVNNQAKVSIFNNYSYRLSVWRKFLFDNMADQVLKYIIDQLSNLALPAFFIILASWRVARPRNLTPNFTERVDASIADTLKEQISEKSTLNANNVILPPGDNVQLLAELYNNLIQFGIEGNAYLQLLHVRNSLLG